MEAVPVFGLFLCVLVSCAERREVHLYDLLAFAGEDGADAGFELLGVDAQKRRRCAQQYDVGGAGRCRALGNGVHVERHDVRQCVEFAPEGFRFGIVRDIDCLLYTSPSPRDRG